jgi:hypothetical protein
MKAMRWPVSSSRRDPLELASPPRGNAPALVLAGAAPDAERLMAVDGVVKASLADSATRAHGLGSGHVSLPGSGGAYREEQLRVR